MHPYLITVLFLLLAGFTQSCDNEQTAADLTESLPPPPESSNIPNPDVITNTGSEMDFARKRYARIERMDEEDRLSCELIEYSCSDDTGGGSFHYCKLDGELVRATHEFNRYDHGGGSEVYYYDGDQLFFTLLTSSSWNFGGPPQTNAAGEQVSGTIDRVLEERQYYYEGNLIERLYKDYTVKSWEVPTPPENIANARTGKAVDNGIGPEGVLAALRTRDYACD